MSSLKPMSMDMTELAQRLVRAEAEIAVLRTSAGRSRRSRTIVEVSVLAALAIVMASARSTPTQAQGVGQTITGPFVVKGPGGNKIFEVRESTDKEQSQMLLFNGQEKVGAAVMTSSGHGMFAIAGSDGTHFVAALTTDTEGNGYLAIGDKDSHPIAEIKKGPNAQGLGVYRPGTNKLAISATTNATLAWVNLRNTEGVVVSAIGAGDDGELQVHDRSNQPIADIDAGTTAGARGLHIHNAKGEVVARATADSDGRGGVAVRAEDGRAGTLDITDAGAEINLARPKGTLKVTVSTEDGVRLNADDGGPPVVELRATQKGGSVRVSNPAGVGVGGLQANATGGGLVLTGPNGGTSAVNLGVDGTGGTVNVFRAAGGNAQASLSAVGGGGVTVYDTSGEPVAMLRAIKETGRLEISRGGQIYVEAGILPSGVGVVRAGPQIGGPAVGLGIPWAIMGKTGK